MSYIFEGQEKKILDVTCGSRTTWFDKQNAHTLYCDKRKEHYQLEWKSTRKPSVLDCEVNPDVQCDFTDLPFPDGQFKMVIFDPPHLTSGISEDSWLYKKYGRLDEGWQKMI